MEAEDQEGREKDLSLPSPREGGDSSVEPANGEETERYHPRAKTPRHTYFGDFPGHDEIRMIPGVHILVVILLSALIFSNSIHNSFVLDDQGSIVNSPYIKSLTNIPRYFGIPDRDGKTGPVGDISLALNYPASGSKPEGYHIVNITIHAASSVLVYFIAFALFQNRAVSLFSSLLFAAHPVHTESVAYISGRWALLSSFFYLLSIHSFLRYRRKRRADRLIGSWLSFLLSIFTHISAVTLPLMVIAYDVVKRLRFYREKRHAPIGREIVGKLGEAMRCCWWEYLLFGSGWMIYGLYRHYLTAAPIEGSQRFPVIGGHAATLARIALHYLKLLLFPIKLVADYSYNAFPTSKTIYDPWALLSYAILILIIAALYKGLRRYRYLVFPGIWLIIGLLPVILLATPDAPIAESSLYLPSVGFCIVAGLVMGHYLLMTGPWGYFLVIAILLLSSYRTLNRNVDWRDPTSIWARTVEDSPQNARAHSNLGYHYALDGRLPDSLSEHKKALEIKDDDPSFYFRIALTFERGNRLDDAIQAYQNVLKLDPKYPLAHNNLGLVYLMKKDIKAAVSHLAEEIEVNPDAAQPHMNLGLLYERSDMPTMALLEYRKAVERDPDLPEARFNLGNLLTYEGSLDEAVEQYRTALKLRPDFVMAHSNLADALAKKGDLKGAEKEYLEALSINDSMPNTHNNLGNAYARMGQLDKAVEEYKRATEIMPNNINFRLNLGSAYELQGDLDKAIPIYEEIVSMVPDLAMVYTFLGRAYATKGMNDKALEAYGNFVEKWEGDEKYTEAIKKRMEELEGK